MLRALLLEFYVNSVIRFRASRFVTFRSFRPPLSAEKSYNPNSNRFRMEWINTRDIILWYAPDLKCSCDDAYWRCPESNAILERTIQRNVPIVRDCDGFSGIHH